MDQRSEDVVEALQLVLLFFDPALWSGERIAEWHRITGQYDATTRVLCDHIRWVIDCMEEDALEDE